MHVLVTLSHVPGVQYIQRTSPAGNDINVSETASSIVKICIKYICTIFSV